MSLPLRYGCRTIGIILAIVLCLSLFAGFGSVGARAATPSSSSPDAGPAVTNSTKMGTAMNATPIDPRLEGANGEITVIVQFEASPSNTSDTATYSARRVHANATQAAFTQYANSTDGIELKRTFWITNAAVVTVDTDRVPLAELARRDEVRRIHADETEAIPTSPGNRTKTGVSGPPSDERYTDGLTQINAPSAWNTFHTKGDGVSVAVLDSGVDASHPDLEVSAWTDFGDDPSKTPVAYDEHGTHVSGIVGGGNASGTHIGVVPNATLLHGAVMTDCQNGRCVGYERDIIAGIEWAIEEGADVIVLSLGWKGYSVPLIDAIENANDAGTVVVASVGNHGEGTSTSPGNIYGAVSVGAVDESASVPTFSGGERIDTRDTWGTKAQDTWPNSYVVPTIVAPGVDVKSTVPGGEYDTKSGTSMAAPHVAGAAALVQSATAADLKPNDIITALANTATTPSGNGTTDSRYGHGIVNAYGAIDAVGTHGTLKGTVVNTVTGTPLANASVTVRTGYGTRLRTTTGPDGTFTFTGLWGDREYVLSVERTGYESTTVRRFVPANKTSTSTVSLAGDSSIEVTLTDNRFNTGIEHGTVSAVGPVGRYPGVHTGNGTYRIDTVPSVGEYELHADGPGYRERERPVSMTSPDRLVESFAMQGDSTLEITVETEGGTPIENASVSIERPSGLAFQPANRTDENGTLEVAVPGTGEHYTIEVSAADFETTVIDTGTVTERSSETVTVSLSDTSAPMPGFGALAAAVAVSAAGVARFVRV